MSTSIYGGRIATSTAELAAEDPVDTMLATNVANNALHYADEAGQVRVAWAAVGSEYLTTESPIPALSRWYPICTFGPFPMSRRANGTPYDHRVRVAACTTTSTNTINIGIAIAAADEESDADPYDRARVALEAGSSNTLTVTTATTASAWISASTLLTPTSEVEDVSLATVSAAGGTTRDIAVSVSKVWLVVFGRATGSAATLPKLTGLYCAEYVGT